MSWTEFGNADLVEWSRVRNAWQDMHRDENVISEEPPPIEMMMEEDARLADKGYRIN